MEIKKRHVDGCIKCNSKILKFEKDIKGKKYPTTCKNCKTILRKIVNYCPYCKSKSYEKWGEKVRNFYSVKCKNCELVYLKNPLSNKTQSLYYKNYATNVHQKGNLKNKQRSIMYKHELNYLIETADNFKKIKDVLDIGCGGGFFLDLLKKYKKNTYGIEVGRDSFEIANRKHKMFYGNFDRKLKINRKFDLIILRGVIEHVDDPKSYVFGAQKILKRNGYIFISATPDLDSIAAKIFKERWTQHRPESHIIHLSEKHVDKLFPKKKFVKLGSKSLYLNTPYENFKKDIIQMSDEIKRQSVRKKSKMISPPFFGNMMTLIYKKRY